MRNETIHETKNETCTDCLEWETCRITGILMQLCLEIKLYVLCNIVAIIYHVDVLSFSTYNSRMQQ